METANGDKNTRHLAEEKPKDNNCSFKDLKNRTDTISETVDKFEQRVNDVQQFYKNVRKKQLNTCNTDPMIKEKDKTNNVSVQPVSTRHTTENSTKRMHELKQQFRTILNQITQNKWASPFLKPVDVVGLGLTDYFEVIEKPMDFTTIKKKMEARDDTGYMTIREISEDVKLIFKNAMTYHDEGHDVHVMAKTLLAEFEEKWHQLLSEVDHHENLCKEEEVKAQLEMQLAEEAVYAKRAMDLSTELDEFEAYLTKLHEEAVKMCRKVTAKEKRQLVGDLTRLKPEDSIRALGIVTHMNPSFEVSVEAAELNIDNESDATLCKLMALVKQINETREKKTSSTDNKKKRELCDSPVKRSNKRSKKLP